MSKPVDLKRWIEDADSLVELVETVESQDATLNLDDTEIGQHLWGRDVPKERAVKILRQESDRLDEYESVTLSETSRAPRYVDLNDLELVSGYEFEHILAEILGRVEGNATVTEASGDQGVDVVWYRKDTTVGIQAKAYAKTNPVGNSAVQEIHTGVAVRDSEYSIDTPAVVTTSRYTASAKEAAENSDVSLYDRSDLERWLSEAEVDSETLGELLDNI